MRQLACDLASASATDVSVARSGGAGVLLQFGETLDIDRSSTDRSSADRGSAGVSNTDTEVNSTTLQLADIQPSVLQTDDSALVRSFCERSIRVRLDGEHHAPRGQLEDHPRRGQRRLLV